MAKCFLCLDHQDFEHGSNRKGHLVDVDQSLLQNGLAEVEHVVSQIFLGRLQSLVIFKLGNRHLPMFAVVFTLLDFIYVKPVFLKRL